MKRTPKPRSILTRLGGARVARREFGQAQQLVFETESVSPGDFAAAAEQYRTRCGTTARADVRWHRPGWSAWARLAGPGAFAGRQPTANLAQRLRPPQVAEQHGHELPPATKPAGMALGPVLDDCPLGAGKQLQHLAENARYSHHGGGGPPMVHVSQRKP